MRNRRPMRRPRTGSPAQADMLAGYSPVLRSAVRRRVSLASPHFLRVRFCARKRARRRRWYSR
jgi:hypothetical protein